MNIPADDKNDDKDTKEDKLDSQKNVSSVVITEYNIM